MLGGLDVRLSCGDVHADNRGMATSIGIAGHSALKRGAVLTMAAIVAATLFAAMVLCGLAWTAGHSVILTLLITVPIVAVEFLYFRKDLADVADTYREGRNWLKGAVGERMVDAELVALPSSFIVFNDVHPPQHDGHAADWNVDHIVVGPTGVFVIDAKNYRSRHVLCSARSRSTKKNVGQVHRNAMELKEKFVTWSNGALSEVFVVPIVVYVQEGVHVESLREGNVRVLPLRILRQEIERHSERHIDADKMVRIATVLFDQMPVESREPFCEDLHQYCRAVRSTVPSSVKSCEQAPLERHPHERSSPLCPKCGTPLVVRTAKTGQHAGSRFLACPRFPDCRHTRPLEV